MEVDWNVVIGEAVTQLLKVLIPVFVALILKWATDLWLRIKADKPDLARILEFAAQTAVFAAEQLIGDGHGEDKRAYAISYMTQYLADQGIHVSIDVIAGAIESAVYSYMNRWRDKSEEEVSDEE